MKKLTPYVIDDLQILKDLSKKNSCASSPYLAHEFLIMKQQYETFNRNNGIPWLCSSAGIQDILAEKLEYHYEKQSPKVTFEFIKKIRKELSPKTCPMCGSMGVSTVDHYLPRADFPEWTIFSKNLVPACDCNSRRSTTVCGSQPNERVLHPYFDDALENRLMSCHIWGDFQSPNFDIIALAAPNVHPDMVEFHLNEIVRKSNIINWLKDTWDGMRAVPSDVIENMEDDETVTSAQLIVKLNKLLGKYDRRYKTKNNWSSVFIHGILQNQNAIDWIVNQQNGIINGTIVTG